MRHVAISTALSAMLFALAITGAPSAALAAGHDGNWSVLVITEKGQCDPAYRYEVTVADGQVSFAGAAAVKVSGTVSTNGAVKVNISGGSRVAEGTGRISTGSGAGTWHGSGSAGACTGRWEAARR